MENEGSREIDKKVLFRIINDLVRICTIFALAVTLLIVLAAVLDRDRPEEAPLGSFMSEDLNEGWSLEADGVTTEVTLPTQVPDAKRGAVIRLTRTLPADLHDGMTLMFRSSMQDMTVSIDGEERAVYSSDHIEGVSGEIPSAYVVCDVGAADAGKEVEVLIVINTMRTINGVKISEGNNGWYEVLRRGTVICVIAFFVLVIGLMLFVASLIVKKKINADAAGYLGLLMADLGMWVLSESLLRQFVFGRPSLSRFFAFFTVELIGVLAAMYFDEVQHKQYHKFYLILESIMLLQLVINISLDALGLVLMYYTLIVSHIWMGITAIFTIATVILDIRAKRIKSYLITAIGMLCFVVVSLGELVAFYIDRSHLFGVYVCIALLLLMAATIGQLIRDEVIKNDSRERNQTEMMMQSIQTIAGAIDAKDEYTGGHSERVSIYAERLAREMAAYYDLSEEDIQRVRYTALMHDIGKIGVADSVLNKSGRLTDEEFSLMKKHTEIGYELMQGMGGFIDGLLDGIRHHHERFDGKGYPDGLSDTDIPLVARILCLADSYDAMTSNRVYRKRLTDAEVRAELIRCAGTQFDPALTEIFVRLLDRGELRASTVDGMASNAAGIVQASARLENKLHQDLLNGVKIVHPSRVRMICYVMKLMERKEIKHQVLFFKSKDREKLAEVIAAHVSSHDINIDYTDDTKIVALYDKKRKEGDAFGDVITGECPGTEVLHL